MTLAQMCAGGIDAALASAESRAGRHKGGDIGAELWCLCVGFTNAVHRQSDGKVVHDRAGGCPHKNTPPRPIPQGEPTRNELLAVSEWPELGSSMEAAEWALLAVSSSPVI